MILPVLDDTIIAVSSAWQPSPLGILRLSGPRAFELLRCVGVSPEPDAGRPAAGWTNARVAIPGEFTLPANIFRFKQPHSYTGQHVVEIHTIGSLPALRRLSAWLIEHGARRALPGEFTARAFLNGLLNADQVDDVLALIQSQDQNATLQAARTDRNGVRAACAEASRALTEVLARIEAGIDFVEEEDVRFITPAQFHARLDEVIGTLDRVVRQSTPALRIELPHVALAGLPNAGKSTLFNKLVGFERAIVTPILGTTRDVLSAEIEVDRIRVVVQDCAGLGRAVDELEAAAHRAAERAMDQADLVLWLHEADQSWGSAEFEACARIPPDRRLLALSKCDRSWSATHALPTEIPFLATIRVSAQTGAGIAELRNQLASSLSASRSDASLGSSTARIDRVLEICHNLLPTGASHEAELTNPELLAVELREALAQLQVAERKPLSEAVLEHIYTSFCVGK